MRTPTASLTTLFAAIALTFTLGCASEFTPIDGEVLGLIVTPAEPVVTIGGEIQLVATAFYDDGQTADVTAKVKWTVMGSDTIELANQSDREGRVMGLDEGTATVMAMLDELTSEPVKIYVTDADVVGLSINPVDLDIDAGESSWLSAMAEFSDGTRGDLSGSVRWITGDASVVTVAADGRATGVGAGATQVRVEYEDIASTPITVAVTEPYEEPAGDDDDDDDDSWSDDDDTGNDTPSGQANLEVTYFEATYGYGETYYFIDVTNTGDVPAEGFYVDLFIDAWSTPVVGEDGDEYQFIEYLDAGETIYADFTIEEDPYYEWWSYVLLDTLEQVDESNEADNLEGPLSVG